MSKDPITCALHRYSIRQIRWRTYQFWWKCLLLSFSEAFFTLKTHFLPLQVSKNVGQTWTERFRWRRVIFLQLCLRDGSALLPYRVCVCTIYSKPKVYDPLCSSPPLCRFSLQNQNSRNGIQRIQIHVSSVTQQMIVRRQTVIYLMFTLPKTDVMS